MVSKAPLGALGLLFLSASLLMLFFIILAGVTDTTPFDKTYFLRADTSGITGARAETEWTYFYVCGRGNTDCSGAAPARPFGRDVWDGGADGVPSGLLGSHAGGTTSQFYFYMWRFGWVFYLISLFFIAMAWFASFLACCGRLGAAIAGLVATTGLFFLTIAVSLMTATFVKARNAFQSDGRDAHVGTYAFGFSWGAWAALLIATVFFCLGLRGDRGAASGGGYSGRKWRRNRSTRSRRSYDVGSRRVKDDYS